MQDKTLFMSLIILIIAFRLEFPHIPSPVPVLRNASEKFFDAKVFSILDTALAVLPTISQNSNSHRCFPNIKKIK